MLFVIKIVINQLAYYNNYSIITGKGVVVMSDVKNEKIQKTNTSQGKRQNGEGCISQRKDGLYTARIQIGTKPDGKPIIKAFYGKKDTEVKRKLDNFKNEIKNLPPTQIKKISFQEYILYWLHTYKYIALKPSSYDRLESTIKNHVIPQIGYLQLAAITIDDIQTLINNLSKEKSYSSVKKVHDAVNACLTHAVIHGDIYKNPCLGVIMPKQKNFKTKEIRILNDNEIAWFKDEIFRQYSNGKYVYNCPDAYILILNTGLRVGEALGLKWTDIDFDKKIMSVKRNIVMVKNRDEDGEIIGGYTKKEQDSTKTNSGTRCINLNNTAITCLNNLYKTSHCDYVICNRQGQPIYPSRFGRTFELACKNASISKCGIHALRHTFASKLFEKGVDIKVVSSLLGHSSVGITYNIYIHIIDKHKQDAVDLIDSI